ncbi:MULTISPECIES: bifunctional UDP-sugar hydrolase/5'-nucleotidase [Methanoculleus]|jgi:sulfur-oxidizing protein SoxB|uniref:2',3'-cyclic-nucleotide 2'-phosphodiesterase/5'-or 3'-nucleotidase, 5'-nucleotidase family n=1 Tax=Methanoculleus thermophilus TaxID=2200 RepID=A0A1G8ZDQ6_9EURY|nr:MULTISPECIES: bifunctional metallophosphatase/5'-nucleotidase [Methanoculleus]NLN08209.1 bifunctional metallophosphatase/5'-nucleotidase [Methanoculleus thermophilus]SDK13242.1 2',3'-cyclic-nucleotide 2'-phosphodiesterase/5'-or 3'-nucleotidase, 5'-nucleotidase family [Methanoculleus thermophilus]HQD25408.1 bifunctional metallophosphatase/5'-nucleotidase [Methanoculleus thermophilus]
MTGNLTLLQMNDSHGYLEPHQELFYAGGPPEYRLAGGYARIATILEEVRDAQPGRVLSFDCGDTIHGTYPAVQSKGEAFIPILNALGFDAMTAHWEFAYGPEQFRKVARGLNYPVLAENCYDDASGDLVFLPYTVCETEGLQVGVIGIAATIVDKVMPDSFSEGIHFSLGKAELPGHITHLRDEEGVDLVVVISHLGFPQDAKLAGEVDGIDILLSGHTHNRLFEPAVVNGTIIIQSGCHGSFLGRLDVTVENRRVKRFSHELIVIGDEIRPEPEVEEMVEGIMDPHREYLSRVVGETRTDLNRNTVLEATMDNLLLQALMDATGAEMAFSNGWRYGAPIPPGPITVNDLWNIIPVNPPVSTVEITGRELRAMMEENLERTFARDPYHQMGGYVKRCAGVNIYCKLENPPGHRIQEFFAAGKPLDPDAIYRAAFVTGQGVPSNYGRNREDLDIRAIEALERYLARGPVSAELRGSVVAI